MKRFLLAAAASAVFASNAPAFELSPQDREAPIIRCAPASDGWCTTLVMRPDGSIVSVVVTTEGDIRVEKKVLLDARKGKKSASR